MSSAVSRGADDSRLFRCRYDCESLRGRSSKILATVATSARADGGDDDDDRWPRRRGHAGASRSNEPPSDCRFSVHPDASSSPPVRGPAAAAATVAGAASAPLPRTGLALTP